MLYLDRYDEHYLSLWMMTVMETHIAHCCFVLKGKQPSSLSTLWIAFCSGSWFWCCLGVSVITTWWCLLFAVCSCVVRLDFFFFFFFFLYLDGGKHWCRKSVHIYTLVYIDVSNIQESPRVFFSPPSYSRCFYTVVCMRNPVWKRLYCEKSSRLLSSVADSRGQYLPFLWLWIVWESAGKLASRVLPLPFVSRGCFPPHGNLSDQLSLIF